MHLNQFEFSRRAIFGGRPPLLLLSMFHHDLPCCSNDSDDPQNNAPPCSEVVVTLLAISESTPIRVDTLIITDHPATEHEAENEDDCPHDEFTLGHTSILSREESSKLKGDSIIDRKSVV